MTTTPDYQRLYRETIPSVVSIYVSTEDYGRHGSGSGFVYDALGHIVTNHHVVGPAESVDVRFSENDWRVGRVVGTDAYTDLAVVRVEALPPYAEPLDLVAANPAPGTPVAALGNPMGLDGSISAGIVSGASRSMPTGNGFAIPDTIQTDAPINPGNSGGPLVTATGKVVGVNRARGGDNIGFAVSAEVVRRVVPALIADGTYHHSYLKIRTLDVSPSVAEANDLDATGGVLVVDVSRGPSRGTLVGCETTRTVRGQEIPAGGDVIVAINGHPVASHESLMRYLLLETRPNEPVELDIVRDGAERRETVTLGERPAPERRRRRGPRRPRGPWSKRNGSRGRDIPIE